MNRYFYYNVFLVSLLNLMLFIPHILINYRYNGAVSSMIIAPFIGTGLAFLFIRVMHKFPGKGLPEILEQFFSKMVAVPILLFNAAIWLIASIIAVVSYAVLINRFFNPDTSPLIVLVLLCLVCAYAATRSSLSMIFLIEMGLLINMPLIVLLLVKAIRSNAISWDAVRTVAHYWSQPPKLQPLGAATFLFTGYMHYAIFNRVNPPNFRLKYRWLIPVSCTLIMLITFFVPIGFNGTETVDDYLYLWSVTSDSMLMSYGFIERVLFVFLILYLNLTLIYTASGWHQAMEFIKSCLPHNKINIDPEKTPLANWIIVSTFIIMTIATYYLVNEKQVSMISSAWLSVRMFTEVGVVGILFILALRRKKSS
ncbi:GerAB/ArcD/ProY family transporter [Paenibacillus nasutitermitis]|uniref:Spore germination protein n=1 Tax=Paenibacillus nasutitermitis TaxID=1652958 RepID=A0A917DWT7_9BACL|nr:GerAB/ArcD/ProY family transporter [Paenibacillus nasutitermitis]GGD73973.1 hypothetical protein GCM10010911_34840 [Paenibacillus nasutitermitis]